MFETNFQLKNERRRHLKIPQKLYKKTINMTTSADMMTRATVRTTIRTIRSSTSESRSPSSVVHLSPRRRRRRRRRGCFCVGALSNKDNDAKMTFQNRTKDDDDDDDDENNKNEEYSKAALTARLSNYCYKNNLKELLESDGYSLVYEKYTSVTRVYIADRKIGFDEMKKEDIVERTIVARGAVWGDDQNVDRIRLSNQISKVWPTQVHPDVPVGCHTGVYEMTEEFFNEITPYIKGPDVGEEVKKLTFCGHSLGGSIAMILAAWTKLRLDVDCVKMKVNVHTYGSPNVLALDMSLLNKMEKEEKETFRGYPKSALDAIGLEESALRAHVLSNDIVPRMWLSHDPVFNTLKSNEWGANLLKWKEETFGRRGMLTMDRFLYEVSGYLIFLELGNDNAAKRAVVKETANLETHLERLTWQLEDFTSGAQNNPLRALAPALEHNSQNYVDVMQYLAVNALLVKRKQ